uniref:Cw16 n=1 Tax=Schizosaccharomyces pombe TaxID=4896 RepID=A0A1X9Q9G8_SCHPM|nr:cw16 [Schizosaccharomyces pombe]
MKNNYTSLKSPIDEGDESKTGHEIDLEKGLLPEYDSEEEGALPPYSDFYETWTKAVKVTAVGLYNSREKWVVIIWLLWVVICFVLFGCVKFGNLNLDKALICSTCSISAALLLFLLYVRLPFWTLKHMFSGLFQVLGVQSCVVIVTKGLMYLFDKHIDATGYEIEATSLFVIGNFFFFYEMECPGALKRMPKFIRNGIASFLGGIANAMMGLANAIGGANDNNNNIPLEETEAESEV